MTELDSQDKALIELARDGCEPTPADRKRTRAALVAQLGVGIGLTSSTTVGAAAASGGAATAGAVAGSASATAAASLAAKLVAGVLFTCALGGGARALHHAERPKEPPPSIPVAAVQAG
jgi:hypothetical protein